MLLISYNPVSKFFDKLPAPLQKIPFITNFITKTFYPSKLINFQTFAIKSFQDFANVYLLQDK